MATTSLELRRRIVKAYLSGLTGSYEETAEIFAVGRATVGRALRRYRQTGDVLLKPRGGNYPRKVDLDWLREHAEREPDARLVDRIEAWQKKSGLRVGTTCMWKSMRAIGWSHKKRRLRRGNVKGRMLNAGV